MSGTEIFWAQNISVPDIGDFKDVEVIEVLVKPGDQINKNDPVVTIESDKSSVEIPSLISGKVKELKVKIGDKVSEGSILATVDNGKATLEPVKEKKTKLCFFFFYRFKSSFAIINRC